MGDLLRHSRGPTITLRTQLRPQLPNALADANQLELAILNLAINSRDAMRSRPGNITVSTSGRNGLNSHGSRARLPRSPVLCLTGYADIAALSAAVGKTPVLRKPFRPSDLASTIRMLLDHLAER